MSALDENIGDAVFASDEAVETTRHHGKAIAASTLWQVASQFVMAVLSVVTVKLVTIGLSKELVGYYNSSYGYLQTFAILADFGLYAVSVREISRAADKVKAFGVLLVLRCIIVALSFGLAISVVWLLPMWRGTPFPIGVTIAALVPVFTLLAGTIRSIFQVHYKMQFVFIAEVLQRILTTVGIGLFVLAGIRLSNDVSIYEWFLWIGGAGSMLLFILSYLYALRIQKIRFCLDSASLKRMIFLAAPYGIAYLLLTLYRQLDVVFITLLRPDFALQNAAYGLAGRVEDMAFLLPTFLLNSILPLLSEHMERGTSTRVLLGRTLFVLLILGSTMLLFSLLWARPLTLLFATPAYLSVPGHPGADMAFALMSVPMFLNGIVLYCFYVFLARHDWKHLIASFGVGVVFTIFFNLLWTRPFGFVGAGAALIVVHTLLAIFLLPQTLRIAPIAFPAKKLIQWLLFTATLAVLLLLLRPLIVSGIGTILWGAVTCGIMLLLWTRGLMRSFSPRSS